MKPNIDYVSVLDDIEDIKERNKAFDALDDQSKRLEIAWDALKLIDKRLISGSWGSYWSYDLRVLSHECRTSKQFQKELNKNSNIEGCSVCARGAVMLSLIRLGNNIKPTDQFAYDGNEGNIKGFSMKSMEQMESEYECSKFLHPYNTNTDEKLMNILCNVLVNGDFNPKDKTNYLIP